MSAKRDSDVVRVLKKARELVPQWSFDGFATVDISIAAGMTFGTYQQTPHNDALDNAYRRLTAADRIAAWDHAIAHAQRMGW